ncbi:MAG: DUF3833 domain-containing protein [Desulfofustis sp.]
MMRDFLVIVFAFLLVGCSKVDITQYADNKPAFDIFSYFEGKTSGWGIVQSRSGKLLRQFVVAIDGTYTDENTLVLEEQFSWSDGEESTRIWTIKKTAAGIYVGTADDVVGTAQGISSGNALNWRYHLNVETEGSTWKIHFDDWMFLQPDQVLLNRASMSKFGIHLGDITIAFTKD